MTNPVVCLPMQEMEHETNTSVRRSRRHSLEMEDTISGIEMSETEKGSGLG